MRKNTFISQDDERDHAHRDPLTGAPGSHPFGAGIGAAAAGLAAGAGIGSFAGPLGTAVGIALGALAGGLAGKGIAEVIDPTVEDDYWRDNYSRQPYVREEASYDDYGPAYRYGIDSHAAHQGRTFDEAEGDLQHGWEGARQGSSLDWEQARHATRDSWQRVRDAVERALPGDADRDGK